MEREIVALGSSIALIVVMVRLRVDLGVTMLAGAALMAIIAGVSVPTTAVELGRSFIKLETLQLLGRIVTIIALGALAGRLGYLDRFVSGLRRLIRDNRVVVAVIPAFGGLLPMPGGAMLTAPMVETALDRDSATAEERFFISYWFRHVWEYIWPLYPAIVFTATLVDRTITDIFIVNYPLTLAAIGGGVLLVLRKVPAGRNVTGGDAHSARLDVLAGIWPFALVIVGVLVLDIELIYVAIVATFLLGFIGKMKPGDLGAAYRRATGFQIISLVLGVAAFKHVLEVAEVVDAVPPFFMEMHMPELVVIAAVPMLIGLVTGVTMAFIGVAFPLLVPLMGGDSINMELVMFAFAFGFVGCMLSPVHLCNVLTREYFKADFGRSYRMLIVPSLIILAVATAIVLI
jgi:integral membrane protein (TIGR00529 family)